MAVLPRSLRLPTLIGFACAVLLGRPAVSQTAGKRLAVLELKGAAIKDDVLDTLADAVRGGAVEGLAGLGVQVMTRENMMVLLRGMGKKDCIDGDCEVETARNIGADFVVSGSVERIDGAFVVTLKLHETKGGSLLATEQCKANRQIDVLIPLREQARSLVAYNIGFRPLAPLVVREQAPEPEPASALPPRPLPQPTVFLTAGKRLAVLEFKGAEIKSDLLDASADAVRVGVIEGLAGLGVQVMTRENIMVLLKDMGKQDCTAGDCEVETARNIGADFVVSGSVERIDGAFVVTLKLYETKGGRLLATEQCKANRGIAAPPQLRVHGRNLVASNVEPRPAEQERLADTVGLRPEEPVKLDRIPVAGSLLAGLEYSSLGGTHSVTRRNVYAAAVHVFLAGFGPEGGPIGMDFDTALGTLGQEAHAYYDLDLLVGPGWWFNQTVAAAALAGVGVDGITKGIMPFAVKTPVRLLLSVSLGSAVRVEARGGVNWLFKTSNQRQSGSRAVRGFADEMVAGSRIVIGGRCAANSGKETHCRAFALGFTYSEVFGTRSLLFMAGIGAGFDPRFE